jgi:CBS domain-containing protein
MHVKDIMIPVLGALGPDATLRDASERMKSLGIDPMPVVVDGQVVGLVSGRAIAERAASAGLAAGSVRVEEVMDRDVVCCREDQPISEALAQAQEGLDGDGGGRLPVTDGSGRLVGVVDLATLRAHVQGEDDGEPGSGTLEGADRELDFESDQVDYMSEESFPASDPLPPPSILTPEWEDE